MEQTAWTQAALFAVEVAAFHLVESWGVVPDYLLVIRFGEIAPPMWPGSCRWPDACVFVAERGRLMQALPAVVSMAAIGAPEASCLAELGEYGLDLGSVKRPTRWWCRFCVGSRLLCGVLPRCGSTGQR